LIARSARCASRREAAHFVVIRRRKACRLTLLLSTAARDPMFDCSLRSLFGLRLTTG
jgi:hypothetical protein